MGFAVVLGLLVHLISPVRADAQAGWLSTASPTITKTSDLAPNASPGLSNRDCTQESFNLVNSQTGGTSTATDCLADSTLGQMGLSGSPVLFSGTNQAVQVNPDYPYLIQPIPNQGMMLALSSAQVVGSYLHFYTDIRQDIAPNYAVNGQLASYTINKAPDFDLRDKNNALISANATGTLSYSSNGSWMLVDSPGGSFLRVNMATFDITPFDLSLNGVGDYSNRQAATAISDDGRYAAVASDQYDYFRVYDLSTCTGTTTNNYTQPLNCQYRDYWPSLASSLSNLHAIYSVRFVNDDNISLTASYNWQSGTSYSVSKFTMTAPGKLAHSLDYLALGDSYISGEGEFQYKAGTDTDNNICHQSPLSYPFIVGADLFNQYNSIACSGAVTDDVTDPYTTYKGQVKDKIEAKNRDQAQILADFSPGYLSQINFVQQYLPRVVTLSVGGNDIGFANIIQKCVEEAFAPPDGLDCYASYASRHALVQSVDNTYIQLYDAYHQIMQADPGVQLYVIGYPQVVTLGNCGLNMPLTPQDISFAQQLTNLLDSTIQQAANDAGARYVDVQNALDGHRLCEAKASDIAMNGVTAGTDSGLAGINFIGKESFHPNVLGHQLLAQAILQQTNNLKQAMPAANTNIQPPTANNPLALAFLGNYPPPPNYTPPGNVSLADDAVGSSVVRGSMLSTSFDGTRFGLAPNSSYQFTAQSDSGTTTNLGSFTTDSMGNLAVSATVPANLAAGFQTFSVTGKNIAGQTTEIYADVYVEASATDFDGDGVPNDQDQCLTVPESGVDTDSDGVDDACDPVIGDTPVQDYPATVRLTGNAIFVGN